MRKFESKSVLAAGAFCFVLASTPVNAAECLPVFNPLEVVTLNLQMATADWDRIRKDLTFEIEVPALFWAEGGGDLGEAPFTVSVRRKSGRALPSETNPQKIALKIDLNEFDDAAEWRGLIKLSLENGAGSAGSPKPWQPGDIDVVKEGLAWAIHRLASGPEGYGYHDGAGSGFASACAAWVRLYINGAYHGVYLSAEQRDKQLLKNRGLWVKGETWFYEQEVGGFALEEGEPDSPTVNYLCYSPFRPKKGLCATPPDSALEADLNEWVNMKGLIGQCAADAIADNGDGLCTHGQNFFFADFLNGQASAGGRPRLYLPWDLDSVIGNDTETSIYGRAVRRGSVIQTPYQSVILNHPVFRANYNSTLLALTDGPLSTAALQAFLTDVESSDLPLALASDPYPTVIGSIADHFSRLRTWVNQRVNSVRAQVISNGPPAPR